MTRKYASFTKEFKLEALRLAEGTRLSIAQPARNLGIRRNMIYKWRAEMKRKKKPLSVQHQKAVITKKEIAWQS